MHPTVLSFRYLDLVSNKDSRRPSRGVSFGFTSCAQDPHNFFVLPPNVLEFCLKAGIMLSFLRKSALMPPRPTNDENYQFCHTFWALLPDIILEEPVPVYFLFALCGCVSLRRARQFHHVNGQPSPGTSPQ